jgi:hypothetical protein
MLKSALRQQLWGFRVSVNGTKVGPDQFCAALLRRRNLVAGVDAWFFFPDMAGRGDAFCHKVVEEKIILFCPFPEQTVQISIVTATPSLDSGDRHACAADRGARRSNKVVVLRCWILVPLSRDR